MPDKNYKSPIIAFGHRRVPPRVCVLDHKPHIRAFLSGMLDELGFIAEQCTAADLDKLLVLSPPDAMVLGSLEPGGEGRLALNTLGALAYRGRVMLVGGRNSPVLMEVQEAAERAGLSMLPPLGTPFRDSALSENLSCFLPIAPSPDIPVDVAEALQNDWLEIWYQPKIHPQSLTPRGAQAIVRARHPTWGMVSPSYYVPTEDDPYFHRLSQFVILRAMADSVMFAAARHPIDISVHLPVPALEDSEFIDGVLAAVPEHIGRRGLQIELQCADVIGDLPWLQKAAAQLAFRNIGIALKDIGLEGASLAGRCDLPVVEMKVGRKYVRGCASDRIKQAVCAEVAKIARAMGVRSVADGIDTQADYLVVRDLGFDLVQGPLFAQPMEMRKFERTMLARGFAQPGAAVSGHAK